MAIKTSSGFDIGVREPLDLRTVVNSFQELATIKTVFDGLECWIVGEQKKYRYQLGEWVEVTANAKVDEKKLYQHFVEINSPDFQFSGRFNWIDSDEKSLSELTLKELFDKTGGVLIPTTEAGSTNDEYNHLQMTGVAFQEDGVNWYFHDYRKPSTEYSSALLKITCTDYNIVKDEVVEIGSIAYSGGVTIEDVRRMCNIVLAESMSYTDESNSWEILD